MCLTVVLTGTVTYNKDKIIKTKGLNQIPQDQITLSNGVLKQERRLVLIINY